MCLATGADLLFLDNNTHAGTGQTYNNTHAGTGHTYNNTHAGTGHTYNNTHARTGQTYTHARAHTSNPTSPHKHTHGRGGGGCWRREYREREREPGDYEMTASSAKPFTSTPVYKGRAVSTGYKAKWRSEHAGCLPLGSPRVVRILCHLLTENVGLLTTAITVTHTDATQYNSLANNM